MAALEIPAVLTFDPVGSAGVPEPVRVTHAHRSLAWDVLRVLDARQEQGGVEVYRLLAAGPLPWQPGQRGEFPLIARRYPDRIGWWITPDGLA